MSKRGFAFFAMIIAICILLSGCNMTLLSTEELIRPPKLSGENSFLQEAFERTVKSDTVQMKSPIKGDNRSSYVITDIDYDGNDEALVFYSDYSVDEFAHVAVFKNDGKLWKNVSILTGAAEEIYSVSFNDVNGDGKKEILISWTSLNPESASNETLTLVGNRILTLYTFNGAGMTLQKTEHFTEMYVSDFNGDGSEDIFLSTVNISYDSNRTIGRIIQFDENSFVKYDESFSLIGMLDVLSIVSDSVVKEEKKYTRIYVDGILSDAAFVTDVVEFDCTDETVNLPIHINNSETPPTARTNKIYSCDINSDGIIEIPTLQELPYGRRINPDAEEPTQIYLVVWSNISDDDLEFVFKCIYNKAQNYYFIFDEEWIGQRTVVYNSNNDLLAFYEVDEDGELGDKLFSIKTFSSAAWNENSYGFERLFATDAYIYGYTLDNADRISKQDIQNSFVVMS